MSTHSSVIYCFLYVFCGNLALWIGQCDICMDLGALQIAAIFSIVLFLVDIYGAKGIIAVLLDIFLFLSYSVIYSYVSFLMRLIEIIKTLTLLFILLHLYGVAITRLAEGCTPLLWPQLLLLPALKLKIDKKTKRSSYCFCSYSILLIIVNLLHAMMIEWLNKTIQTTLCRWLTCKTTTIFSDNNR